MQLELLSDGKALPWADLRAFLQKVTAAALDDIAAVGDTSEWVFFDRGLMDAAIGLQHLTGEPVSATLDLSSHYHQQVFLAPPWPEIYVQDVERRHALDAATAEYDRLLAAYPSFGYNISILPKTNVAQRADFVLKTLMV